MSIRILLLITLTFTSVLLRAEHLPGGSITYECLGNNTYTVSLTLYRECTGEPMIPQDLRFSNDCGVVFTLDDLVAQEVVNVSPLCTSEAGNSSCNDGPLLGIEAYTFRQTLFLSPCNAWTIAWYTCCRQSSVNVQGTPGLYIEARLNNENDLCNNSPVTTDQSIPVVCVGQPVVYDPGVVESDGHTLEYRFVEARFGTPDPLAVIYNFPYFGLEPFTGMLIDEETGRITFTPTIQGYVVTAFQVDEYDEDGTWIGSIMRDFPFLVRACSNTVPTPTAGLISGVTGAAQQLGDREIRLCGTGQMCWDLVFTDPDAGQSLGITSNVGIVLPGATVSANGTNPLNVQICWEPTDATPMERNFTVVLNDGVCPLPGTQWYTYRVVVEAAPDSLQDGSALACPQTEPFALVDSLGTFPSMAGTWIDPNGESHPGIFTPPTDVAGAYTFTAESFPGCTRSAVVSVLYLAADDTLCSLVSVPELLRSAPVIHPNPGTDHFVLRDIEAYGRGPFMIHVLDLQGRSVALIPMPQKWGDASFILPPGTATGSYLLRLESPTGNALPVRIVVQR